MFLFCAPWIRTITRYHESKIERTSARFAGWPTGMLQMLNYMSGSHVPALFSHMIILLYSIVQQSACLFNTLCLLFCLLMTGSNATENAHGTHLPFASSRLTSITSKVRTVQQWNPFVSTLHLSRSLKNIWPFSMIWPCFMHKRGKIENWSLWNMVQWIKIYDFDFEIYIVKCKSIIYIYSFYQLTKFYQFINIDVSKSTFMR